MTNASVAALLDDGSWTVAKSVRICHDARRLRDQTGELLLTFRRHRLRVVAGGTGHIESKAVAMLGQLLKSAPGQPVCGGCLALALSVSLQDAQALTDELSRQSPAFSRGGRACTSCGRTTSTISYDRRDVGQAPLRVGTPRRRDATATG